MELETQKTLEIIETQHLDTQAELEAIQEARGTAIEILDKLPINSQARTHTRDFVDNLSVDEEFIEQILQEEEESIASFQYI